MDNQVLIANNNNDNGNVNNINNNINNIDYNNIPEQVMPDINDLILEQKPFIDDDYILHLHQRLGQTRELRKIAENGIKILNARINCLENENQRTLSKISITSKKTNNKLLNLEQKKNHSKEKIEHLKKLENDLKILKQKNKNIKNERDNGLINSRKNVITQNKIKGKLSKKEKEDISNIKKMYELNEQNMKKSKVELMKNDLMQNNKMKKMLEITKKEKMIKDLEDRINYEINKKEELEEQINKMLQDENETLERIKKTDIMQKKIFEDFQKALNEGNEFYNINFNFPNDEDFIEDDINNNDNNDNNGNYEENKDF
jgi:chromosome segregation ATPase